MFLGAYQFDGESSLLLDAYNRLMASYPPDSIELHVCVVTERGLTVLDACPSESVFTEFSQSDGFAAAIAAAGLPTPTIVPMGEVHAARVRESALP